MSELLGSTVPPPTALSEGSHSVSLQGGGDQVGPALVGGSPYFFPFTSVFISVSITLLKAICILQVAWIQGGYRVYWAPVCLHTIAPHCTPLWS